MNIIKREWKANARQTIYWSLGLLCLLCISFYKVQGLASAPGGIHALMKSFPPALQAIFGVQTNANTGLGAYQMIHLYIAITLALHAAILGATIFSKEEHDRTFEFLYVKGVTRYRILFAKNIAGLCVLLTLLLVIILGVYGCVIFVGYTIEAQEIMPYISSLGILQLFVFALTLLISLCMRNNEKAGIIGCCIVCIMFMITMYVKMGGKVAFLDACSLFHYVDVNYISAHTTNVIAYGGVSLLSIILLIISQWLHNKRDLLN